MELPFLCLFCVFVSGLGFLVETTQILQDINANYDSTNNYQEVVDIIQSISRAYRKKLGKPEISDDSFNPLTTEIKADENPDSELNKGLNPFLFYEGDIVLTKSQASAILMDTLSGRKKRKITSNTALRWHNKVVPFDMENSLTQAKQNVIADALFYLSSETCLNFVPWYQGGGYTDYMSFFSGGGCFSSVGRVGNKQPVSIGDGCDIIGIVAHEIGHALGLWHEQSRADRDSYVNVLFNNIYPNTEYNFQKKSGGDINTYSQPYDYGSVMHYGPRGFSTDYWNLRTIETRDPKFQNTIGQRVALSFIDLKQINTAYCSDDCSHVTNRCENQGYPDPRDCYQCKCPEGLGGTTCNVAQTSSPSYCGDDLTASTDYQYITSPAYPDRLYEGTECYWHIKAPYGARIAIEITDLQFTCRFTCTDYVEIKAEGYPDGRVVDFRQTGMRFCCDERVGIVYSDLNEAIVILKTKVGGDPGFKLRYYMFGLVKATTTTTERPTPVTNQPAPDYCWLRHPWTQCATSQHPDFIGRQAKSRRHYCVCPTECSTYTERVAC